VIVEILQRGAVFGFKPLNELFFFDMFRGLADGESILCKESKRIQNQKWRKYPFPLQTSAIEFCLKNFFYFLTTSSKSSASVASSTTM
jgi:hypothetical protein